MERARRGRHQHQFLDWHPRPTAASRSTALSLASAPSLPLPPSRLLYLLPSERARASERASSVLSGSSPSSSVERGFVIGAAGVFSRAVEVEARINRGAELLFCRPCSAAQRWQHLKKTAVMMDQFSAVQCRLNVVTCVRHSPHLR